MGLPISPTFSPDTGQVVSWSGFAGAFVEVSALAVDVNAVAASVNPAIMMDLTVRLNCFISSILNCFCLLVCSFQRVRLNAAALFLPRRRQNPSKNFWRFRTAASQWLTDFAKYASGPDSAC